MIAGSLPRRAFLGALTFCFLAHGLVANSLPTRIVALEKPVREARKIAPALGVHVVEVSTGQEVYSYKPGERRILASNTKLLTTAAALDRLSPDYEFETPILIRGPVYTGTLTGDLAVVGSGDPNISGRFYEGDSYAVFRQWASALRARGILRVAGDLVLVNGLFEAPLVHPDWPEDQHSRWYEAPVETLSFSDNCVLIKVLPGESPGAPVVVTMKPDLGLLQIRSSATTTKKRRESKLIIERLPGSSTIAIRGRLYQGTFNAEAWVSVPDPARYFAAALQAALAEEGIEVLGKQKIVDSLPGAVWERVAVHRSGLLQTLEVVNHRSQNFYAEALIKTLGARLRQKGSWPAGLGVVKTFLVEQGLDGDEIRLADGSGMSRNNEASPRQLTRLLRNMYHHEWALQFFRSLPASGKVDTTWEKRLNQPPYRGRVVAKTGTLRGVSTLSGYAQGESGRVYAFSILCNQTVAWRAKAVQDKIVKALIDNG